MYSIFHNITAEQSFHLQRFANHFDISNQYRNISCEQDIVTLSVVSPVHSLHTYILNMK